MNAVRVRDVLSGIQQCSWDMEESLVVATFTFIEHCSIRAQIPEPLTTAVIWLLLAVSQISIVTEVFHDVLVHTLQPY